MASPLGAGSDIRMRLVTAGSAPFGSASESTRPTSLPLSLTSSCINCAIVRPRSALLAGATVDGTRTGAVVESSVELTPSPHGSFLRHYHGPVFPHAARYFRRAVSPKISRGDRAASFLRMPNLTRGRDAKGRLLATWSEIKRL